MRAFSWCNRRREEIHCLKEDEVAADARDSIRRDTASLDTAGTDTEDLDPFEGIEDDEDEVEANKDLLEDC